MYLMAAFPTYYKSGNTGNGRRHDNPRIECSASNSGNNSGACSAASTVDFGLLEIDENDNSFPWGLIHHTELAHMLNGGLGKTMVIDSRSFLEYNTSTIQQSVNVCCSKLVKRRLQQDKVHVLDLLNQTCNIGADTSWDVIVYDQCTEDPSQLTSDNFVAVLLHKLSTTFNSVAFLKGGFLAFQASHPSLTENKSSSHRCSTLTSLSQPCMPVSNVGPTRILPFLYLGSQQDSLNQELAQVNGITYILNVSKTCPRPPFILEGHFHRIPVNDNYCEKLLPFFQEAFQFLDKVREANGCVLIHCLGGVSRSATLAIAYIMRYYRMSSDEAYRYVKDKRPTISPNFNFLGQLLEYEKILRQEEHDEFYRKKNMRDEEEIRGEVDRANPGVMYLHTSSPSSPGPRLAQRPFIVDFSSSPLHHSLVASSLTSSSRKFMVSRQPVPEVSTMVPALKNSSHIYRSADAIDSLHFPGHSYELYPFPGPRKSEFCPLPEPSTKSRSGSQSTCVRAAYHNLTMADATLSPANGCVDISTNEPNMTYVCDITTQGTQPVVPQSPVCPITGFPSPASAMGSFPQTTCPKTGFPSPGSAMGSYPESTCPKTGFPSPGSAMGSYPQTTCPKTGFPSPGSAMGSYTQSTCPKTGFPSPGTSTPMTRPTRVMTPTNSVLSPMTRQTEEETVYKNNATYQNFTATGSSLSGALTPQPTIPSLQSNVPESNQDLFSKISPQKGQTRTRTGFSLSSVLSSFRWKSKPQTLSLGSPVGNVKDVNRHLKKHSVEISGVGDGRVQLTPVSEAVENCDLITSDVACEEMNERLAETGPQLDCSESMDESGLDCVMHVRTCGSSPSNATTIAMASTHNYLSSLTVSSAATSLSQTHTVAVTSTSSSCVVKPSRLSISARRFTLPLSSPTSDFPAVLTSPLSLPSPGDSNKRKSFHPSSYDSPDKLAKTETSHLHALSPPKTLNLAQGFPAKVRLRTSFKRPFVLPISSPTAATMEDMARLKVTSPSDPPTEAAIRYEQMASGDRHRDCHSGCLDFQSGRKIPLGIEDQESIPRMVFKSSDPRCVSDLKTCVPYGHTKWKSALSLSVGHSGGATNSILGEQVTLSEAACPLQQQTDTSLLTSGSVTAMSLSSSLSLSKSCTSIHAATSSSISNRSSSTSCSVNLQGFSQFPTTSLDKLSFTPCYTKDIVQELKRQEAELVSSQHDTSPSDGILRPSVLDSPMSICSGSSAPSIASSTISPVESSLTNAFSANTFHTPRAEHSSTAFHFEQSSAHLSSSSTLPNCSSPQDSALSSSSTPDFILSPLSMPQTSVALTSPQHSSSLSLEPISPMSISDSTSSSPLLRSPTRSSITSPLLSLSTPASCSSSPVISSPPFSPLLSSPTSSSSHVAGAAASIASSLSTKVVLRKDKNKRMVDRPNSIAFSSYPACELVPASPGSQQGHSQSSLDDSSEAYMSGKSKRSRHSNHPESHLPQGRTSWGGYSEREMYRQITAAMENAMLRTQVFSSGGGRRLTAGQASSRKARSLDDIVDSNADEDSFLPSQPGNTSWGMCTEPCTFDQYRCGMQNVSEPYHSSSSLSSNGSHSGSMEIQTTTGLSPFGPADFYKDDIGRLKLHHDRLLDINRAEFSSQI